MTKINKARVMLAVSMSVFGIICIMVIGVIHTGVTYCLYFSSIKELRGQETAVLSYIDRL